MAGVRRESFSPADPLLSVLDAALPVPTTTLRIHSENTKIPERGDRDLVDQACVPELDISEQVYTLQSSAVVQAGAVQNGRAEYGAC